MKTEVSVPVCGPTIKPPLLNCAGNVIAMCRHVAGGGKVNSNTCFWFWSDTFLSSYVTNEDRKTESAAFTLMKIQRGPHQVRTDPAGYQRYILTNRFTSDGIISRLALCQLVCDKSRPDQ